MANVPAIPDGVRLVPLVTHRDARGSFTEVFRVNEAPVPVVQWNVVHSRAGVLRGVHVHRRHADYLLLPHGRASVGLRDIRPGSPTEGLGAVVELREEALVGLVIPPGVAHGFFFREPSIHLYGVTHYWDPEDELGCHWADPELGIPWDVRPTELSPRDRDAPPLRVMIEEWRGRGP